MQGRAAFSRRRAQVEILAKLFRAFFKPSPYRVLAFMILDKYPRPRLYHSSSDQLRQTGIHLHWEFALLSNILLFPKLIVSPRPFQEICINLLKSPRSRGFDLEFSFGARGMCLPFNSCFFGEIRTQTPFLGPGVTSLTSHLWWKVKFC